MLKAKGARRNQHWGPSIKYISKHIFTYNFDVCAEVHCSFSAERSDAKVITVVISATGVCHTVMSYMVSLGTAAFTVKPKI